MSNNIKNSQLPKFLSLGRAKAHHAAEDYYLEWEKLFNRSQKAYSKARRLTVNKKAWDAYERAQNKLSKHENCWRTDKKTGL